MHKIVDLKCGHFSSHELAYMVQLGSNQTSKTLSNSDLVRTVNSMTDVNQGVVFFIW